MRAFKPVDGTSSFHHLSVKDLIEARDTFHVHLMNKRNVVATAIGRYLIRKTDFVEIDGKLIYKPTHEIPKKPRTIAGSIVTDFSWPCMLVFVKVWEEESALINDGGNNILPKSIYMPDGRVIPVCVVQAPKAEKTDTAVKESALKFPVNLMSGGFPLIIFSQGEQRIASAGCLVTDGNKIFVLTNKHVAGKPGTEIFSRLGGTLTRIGVSAGKQLGKKSFTELYPGFVSKNLVVNNDVGLVEIDDVNQWKTEVFGIGQINELKDFNTFNLSLDLITKKVTAFGAVSHDMDGQVIALFYRYNSVGGVEYIADYLIGGDDGKDLNTHHGDSGTLWLIEDTDDENKPINRPFALHWGQHELMEGSTKKKRAFALATSLSNICRELDIELVRGWNLDQEYSWGKVGHFKIGAQSCDLVSNKSLKMLLQQNKFNIGYSDVDLSKPQNLVKGGSGDFTPLADVADLVWRPMNGNKGVARMNDESNHFADMDDHHPDVMSDKTLLKLCFDSHGKIKKEFVDKDKWLDFYAQMDEAKPEFDKNGNKRRRLGALPFRVWQMYDLMVEYLSQGMVEEFVCAGGTMAHYVGDACQALHISYKHHGLTPDDYKVHGDYEDKMLNNSKNQVALFAGLDAFDKKVTEAKLVETGKGAAMLVVKLMKETFDTLSPDTVIAAWKAADGVEELWKKTGTQTIKNINNGSLAMATIWQSAWVEGNGDAIAEKKLGFINPDTLKGLYTDKSFVPSFNLDKLVLKEHVLA